MDFFKNTTHGINQIYNIAFLKYILCCMPGCVFVSRVELTSPASVLVGSTPEGMKPSDMPCKNISTKILDFLP